MPIEQPVIGGRWLALMLLRIDRLRPNLAN
jgi:hypothetical protein